MLLERALKLVRFGVCVFALGSQVACTSHGGTTSGGGGSGAAGRSTGGSGTTGAGVGGSSTAGSGSPAGITGSAGRNPVGTAGASGGSGVGTGGTLGGSGGGGMAGSGGPPIPVITVGTAMLKVEVCTDTIVRVAYAPTAGFFTRASLATAPKACVQTPYQVTTAAGQMTVATAKLQVRVDTATGGVTFLDPAGKTILAEKTGGGRTITPATVNGEQTTNVRQEWQPPADESLYGLGQHQHGLLDIKDTDFDLRQYNTEVFIPYLVSSHGYGILWDNTSYSRFGDLGDAVPLPGVTGLYASGGDPGDVNPGTGTVSWSGMVTPTVSGDYTFRTFSAGQVQLSVNNQVVIDHWRQGWLPAEDIAHVSLTAGQAVPVRLTWQADGTVNVIRLLWKPPVANRTTSLWSQVGDGIDYYFVYGPALDSVVAGYRRLTGTAAMLPQWAFGFWQSREHYKTAQEITDVLSGYRSRKAPIDNIVQDWQYWTETTWGSHAFDVTRYPDPVGMIKTVHDTYHAHFMISVWPKFYTGIPNFTALNTAGFLYQPNVTQMTKDFVGYTFTFYDAFSAAARQLYWSQMNTALFSKGVDAWWLDASEPDIVEGPFSSIASQITTFQTHMNPTALGSGSRMLNAYSLVNSQAVYEGQRTAAPNQRVFILTRNGFAGQQRYSAATWSGDISSTWTAMRKQIPAGLSFSISGMPYWTLDGGGFATPARFAAATPTVADQTEWRELNTRWFEYATFLPLLRMHGEAPLRELWQFGGDTSTYYQAMLKFDRLRYRLLPYIYSLAGAVTQQDGTILRPLVMDFPDDAMARRITDQYLFGPALLVSPITTYKATSRTVYLPAGTAWYDFWTGTRATATGNVSAAAALDAIPVYVRAGAILPTGPDLQYTNEKPADPITIYVYGGADGAFTLYEDQGTTNDYEKGGFASIPLRWSDATRTLTIGARTGSFTGMLTSRTFQIVLVTTGKAVGFSFTPTPDKMVTYTGTSMDVTL